MKAFSSWSGGKDCMLALHRFLKDEQNEVACLVNMCENHSEYSLSHGIKNSLIKIQANKMDILLIQKTKGDSYEASLKEVIAELKSEGITAGVFGDIYLQEHRVWIERVCKEMGIEAVFPLWGEDTTSLLKEFLNENFKALTVSVRQDKLSDEWLGKELNAGFLDKISKLNGVDPCAENGEYHTFVYDGPLFKNPVDFKMGEISQENGHYFLELIH